jgi:RNA polymerase sigma factor (sigma-70 family)
LEKNKFISACREGGPAIDSALRSLDRSYFAVLYNDCRRMIRNADLARELVHEAFIKVWQRCATFHGDSELLPWIRAILRRVTLDRLRAPAREINVDWDEMEPNMARHAESGAVALPEAPDVASQSAESAACFARCWQRFVSECPQHAAVLAWIAQDDMTHEQIAELLDRTPGATREYISQCRKRARHYLAEWYALEFGARA